MGDNEAELVVRRFFQHYMDEVWPEQLETVITAHNKDVTAHAPQIKAAVTAESSHIKLWLVGLVFTVGAGSGVGVTRLIAAIVNN